MSNAQQRNVNVRQWQCFYRIMTATVRLESQNITKLFISVMFKSHSGAVVLHPIIIGGGRVVCGPIGSYCNPQLYL